jgi:heme exporter protein D
MMLVYLYALFLFLAFAASLAALIFYVWNDYYSTILSALVAATSYFATRIAMFFIIRKEN